MYEGVLKLEANDQGVWISALKETLAKDDVKIGSTIEVH